jgi:hypothetical protein
VWCGGGAGQGRVWSWGVGYYGQLGHGALTSDTHLSRPRVIAAFNPHSPSPFPAPSPSDPSAAAAAAAASSPAPSPSLIKRKAKTVTLPLYPPPPSALSSAALAAAAGGAAAAAAGAAAAVGQPIVAVSAGFQHSLFLAATGDVFSCGKGLFGALGVWRVLHEPHQPAAKAQSQAQHSVKAGGGLGQDLAKGGAAEAGAGGEGESEAEKSMAEEARRAHLAVNSTQIRLDTPACIQAWNRADHAAHKRPLMGRRSAGHHLP